MAEFRLADIAPRLAKARDQRREELRIRAWNDKAYTLNDRAPIEHSEFNPHYTYNSRTIDQIIFDEFSHE